MIVNLNTLKMHGMGSITNAIDACHNDATPAVGMGATLLHWTDRTACSVVEVGPNVGAMPAYIVLQDDDAIRTDGLGMSDCQSYRYEPNPTGNKRVAKFHAKSGKWREVDVGNYDANGNDWTSEERVERAKKRRPNKSGTIVKLGARSAYHDYSF